MSNAKAGGLVLAANYMFLDQRTLGFWSNLSARLDAAGMHLLMLSTTPVENAPFPVLPIPYHLAGFATRYNITSAQPPSWAHTIVELAVHADQQTPRALTESGTAVAAEFYSALFEALQPVAAIGWNAMHAHTQLFTGLARLFGVPAWAGERGWLRDTMMFDLGENTLLTEWSQSLSLRALQRDIVHDAALYARLRDHYLATREGKYAAGAALAPQAARARLGIAPNKRVLAAFTHAEPGIHGPVGAVRPSLHDASPQRLDAALAAAACHAGSRGAVLLVQEHPINVQIGITRPLATAAGARFVRENPYTLLDLADASLHSHSTLQFDAVFFGRPIVLLERTMLELAVAPAAHALADYRDVGACLDAALDGNDWPARQRRLEALVSTLAKYQLIDTGHGVVPNGPELLVDAIARFARPPPTDLDARISAFLAAWGEANEPLSV